MMIWVIDDDGGAMFRLVARGSPFGPMKRSMSVQAVENILNDLARNSIETETLGIFTRNRSGDDTSETVWKGRITVRSHIPDAREYFARLSLSYRGE